MISQKQQNRNDYIVLLTLENIPNILGLINELPYSRKLKILEKLLKKYNKNYIIVALEEYKRNYIYLDRVNIFTIENILIGICNILKNREKNNVSKN